MARVASVSTSLTLESQSFISGLKKAVDQSAASSAKIERHMNTIVNAGKALGGAAMVNEIYQLGARALDYASSLGEVAQQLGVTTKDLQVYRYAATQVGVSQEDMDKGLAKLTVTIGKAADGSKAQATTFRDLGVSVRTATGDVRNAGEVIPDLAEALSKVKDPATRARIEVELLGKSGQKLDTLLAGGSAGVSELAQAAESLGVVLSDEQIQSADNTADKLASLKMVLEARIAGVVADNADSILALADSFVSLVGSIGQAIDAYKNWANITTIYAPFASKEKVEAAKGRLVQTKTGRKEYLEDIRLRQTSGQITQAEAVAEMRRLSDAGYAASSAPSASSGRGSGAMPIVDDGGSSAKAAQAKAKAAAEKAAREAEQAQKQARTREDRYQSELARSEDEFLGLRASLSTDARQRAAYEHEQAQLGLAERDRARQMDVADGQLLPAMAAELKLRDERNTLLSEGLINRRLDAELTQESLDLLQSDVGNQRDLLTGQLDLAKTSSERRDLELQLLALQKREEKARLQSVLTMEDGTDNLNTSKTQKDIARDRLNLLDRMYGNAEESTKRSTMGPGEAYLAEINKSSSEKAEAFQTSAVNGLKSLEDQLTDTATASFKLKGAFGSMASSVVSDLMRIAIQKNITGPLANMLFGGSSGGSSGGLLQSVGGFFGLGKGLGINNAAAAAGASYNFGAIPGLAKGGTIGGFSGIDKNLLSINGAPVARVMRGEQLRVEPNNDNARGAAAVYQTIQFTGAVDMADRAYVDRMAMAAKQGAMQAMDDRGKRRG